MRTILALLLASALALPARAANVQVQVRDFTSGVVANRVCTVTLTKPQGSVVAGPWIIAGDYVSLRTGADGTCTFSNLLTIGEYRLDVSGNPGRPFPFNMSAATTNGTWNIVSLLGTNAAVPAFYDTAQVDALVATAGTIKAITSQDGTVVITTNGSVRDLSAVGGGGSTNGFTGTQVTNAAAYQAQLATNGLAGLAAFHPVGDFYSSGNPSGYQTAGQVSSSIVSAQPIMTNAALTVTTALSTNFALLNAGTNQFAGKIQIKTTNQAPISIQDSTGKEFFHMALTPSFQGLGTFYGTYIALENTPDSLDPQLRIYDDPGAGNQGVILAYNSTNATFKHHLNLGASGEIYLDPLNGDAIRALSRIEPYTPGAYSIGSASAHWLNGYFDNVSSTNFTGNAAGLTNYPVATATTSGAEPPPGGNNLFRVSDAGGNPVWSSYSPGSPTFDTVGGGTNAGVSQGVGAGSILQPASSGQIIATFAQSVNASTVQGGVGNRLALNTLGTNSAFDGAVMKVTGPSLQFTRDGSSLTNISAASFGLSNTVLFIDGTSGNDATAQRGKQGLPFQTLQAAASAALPGDAYEIAPGYYAVGAYTWKPTNAIVFAHGATLVMSAIGGNGVLVPGGTFAMYGGAVSNSTASGIGFKVSSLTNSLMLRSVRLFGGTDCLTGTLPENLSIDISGGELGTYWDAYTASTSGQTNVSVAFNGTVFRIYRNTNNQGKGVNTTAGQTVRCSGCSIIYDNGFTNTGNAAFNCGGGTLELTGCSVLPGTNSVTKVWQTSGTCIIDGPQFSVGETAGTITWAGLDNTNFSGAFTGLSALTNANGLPLSDGSATNTLVQQLNAGSVKQFNLHASSLNLTDTIPVGILSGPLQLLSTNYVGTGPTNSLGQPIANAIQGIVQAGATTNNHVVTLAAVGDVTQAGQNNFTGSNYFGGPTVVSNLTVTNFFVQNFYPTNFYSGKTNVGVLGTDANGLLVTNDWAVQRGSATLTNVANGSAANLWNGHVDGGNVSNAVASATSAATASGLANGTYNYYDTAGSVYVRATTANYATNGPLGAKLLQSGVAENGGGLTNLTYDFPTNAAPIWTPVLDGNKPTLHFVSSTNFTLAITNFPTASARYPSITVSNSGANASTILITCSGFCVLTNGYPTSTFYATNLTAKRQQVRVDACFDPVGPMTNGIVTHLFDK